jgi:hypothetical protein
MRLEKVTSPYQPAAAVTPGASAGVSNGAKVIPFAEIKKDK